MNRLFLFLAVIDLSELKTEGFKMIYSIVNLTKSFTTFIRELIEENLSKSDFYLHIPFTNVKLKNGKTMRDLKIDFLPIYCLPTFSIRQLNNHCLFYLFFLFFFLNNETPIAHQNFIFRLQKFAFLKDFKQVFYFGV